MVNPAMQNVLDHFKDPENYGVLENYTHSYELKNLSCGDTVHVYLLVEDNIIKNFSFTGEGCAISLASASMLSDEIIGLTIDEFLKIDSNFIKNLVKMDLGPSRLKCATMTLEATRKAIN
ncbi:iron-sulfur cluster assembly scaffold protein [bacterium]|jgi:nitrogen fixation protein NifU and related proteins|nr:iron-sulfur cluster assembly scaffold protein [bacterium]MBT6294060.1 iron-sulfur cluster assembly scaffold protein [bacterium]